MYTGYLCVHNTCISDHSDTSDHHRFHLTSHRKKGILTFTNTTQGYITHKYSRSLWQKLDQNQAAVLNSGQAGQHVLSRDWRDSLRDSPIHNDRLIPSY